MLSKSIQECSKSKSVEVLLVDLVVVVVLGRVDDGGVGDDAKKKNSAELD